MTSAECKGSAWFENSFLGPSALRWTTFRSNRLTNISNRRIPRSVLAVAGAQRRTSVCIVGVPHLGAVPSAVPRPHSLRTCALWRPMRSRVRGQHRFAKPLREAVFLPKKGCVELRSSPPSL